VVSIPKNSFMLFFGFGALHTIVSRLSSCPRMQFAVSFCYAQCFHRHSLFISISKFMLVVTHPNHAKSTDGQHCLDWKFVLNSKMPSVVPIHLLCKPLAYIPLHHLQDQNSHRPAIRRNHIARGIQLSRSSVSRRDFIPRGADASCTPFIGKPISQDSVVPCRLEIFLQWSLRLACDVTGFEPPITC